MTAIERLEISSRALKEYNPDQLSAIEDISVEDLAKLSADYGLREQDYPKLIGVMIYIRHRLVEKEGRIKAFKAAFPERSIATAADGGTEFGRTAELGEPLHNTTIDIKAKRLEASRLYLHVYQTLQTNLYINYAVDRMRVLDEALSKSLDPDVADRDKAPYMKLFLDETRKPEGAKGLEFNLNITNNDLSVVDVEARMTDIAKKLEGSTAAQIIDAVDREKHNDS